MGERIVPNPNEQFRAQTFADLTAIFTRTSALAAISAPTEVDGKMVVIAQTPRLETSTDLQSYTRGISGIALPFMAGVTLWDDPQSDQKRRQVASVAQGRDGKHFVSLETLHDQRFRILHAEAMKQGKSSHFGTVVAVGDQPEDIEKYVFMPKPFAKFFPAISFMEERVLREQNPYLLATALGRSAVITESSLVGQDVETTNFVLTQINQEIDKAIATL